MPVILNNGSPEMFTWLDSNRIEWSRELQSLLKPYDGELECYAVPREVGKVGNDSPTFIIPIDSSENKQNIANFFGKQKKLAVGHEAQVDLKKEEKEVEEADTKVKQEKDEERVMVDHEGEENNAPMPVASAKRRHEDDDEATDGHNDKKQELHADALSSSSTSSARKSRSATTNTPRAKPQAPASDGSQRITNFFNK